MQERAVQAYLNWMTRQGKNTFTTRLLELRAELDALIDAMVSHTAVFRKKADEQELLIGHYETLAKAGGCLNLIEGSPCWGYNIPNMGIL
ncbi:hypothetical protein K5Z09_005135 [Escherichia coli]|nr:hypothetical protein [Escherichia coli]EHR8683437.1 hypothetical protein [Escherichia coli]EHR8987861.1 hypothetical protein [Escherichia coli]EHR9097196.1 hypothetical protein [Escherichia coli]EHR9219678.1 hypothetical protein [Escherichia coli]